MALKTVCPECSQKLKIEDEMVGVSIRCPKCGHVFAVTSLGHAGAGRSSRPHPPPSHMSRRMRAPTTGGARNPLYRRTELAGRRSGASALNRPSAGSAASS